MVQMARTLIFLKPKYSDTNQKKHLTKAPHEISKSDSICVGFFYFWETKSSFKMCSGYLWFNFEGMTRKRCTQEEISWVASITE